MLLLIGGGLLMRSFIQLANVPLGYDPSHVLTLQVALPEGRSGASQIQAFAEDFVGRLRQLPEVQAAAYVPVLPLTTLLKGTASLGRSPQAVVEPAAEFRGVSPGYFKTMGIPVIAGREFDETDRKGAPQVVMINRALAGRDYPGQSAVGRMVYLNNQPQPWQVIGIVEDLRQVALDQQPGPQIFADCRQWPGMAGLRFLQYYGVRTAGDPLGTVPRVREVLQQIEPRAALYNIAPMQQLVDNSVSRPRLYAVLAIVFAAVSAVLAATGLFGLVAYVVAGQTREIGVRLALGAAPSSIVASLVRRHVTLAGMGILIGLAGAAAVSGVLRSLLFQLRPLDLPTFSGVSLLFLGIAALAAYLPARRAARVDPLIALRSE